MISGVGKLTAYAAIATYMASFGVPAAVLPLVIGLEIIGALAIMLGWQTRIAALLLAGFALLSAVIFHQDFANQIEMVMFLKNVAIAGGFLLLAVNGAGAFSIDHAVLRRRAGTKG